MIFFENFSISKLKGLRPTAWICIDSGFSREEVKEVLFSQKIAFISDSVLNPEALCLKIISSGRSIPLQKERVLGSLSRQEVLRALLSEPRISKNLPELKRLKRRGRFFKRLDRTLQNAQKAFGHLEEEKVYFERLAQLLPMGISPLRNEMKTLFQAYSAWMRESDLWDLPLMMRECVEILRAASSNHPITQRALPREIFLFSTHVHESLEHEFWNELGRWVEIKPTSPGEVKLSSFRWEQWHTLDDAAETLAESLSNLKTDHGCDYSQQAILAPDLPEIRRSLQRALRRYSIPLLDPRDPMRLRFDEGLKWALLPLKLVGKNYDRSDVLSWLSYRERELKWIPEINARGIRNGLQSYAGGDLTHLYKALSEIEEILGGKKTVLEVGEAFLQSLKKEMMEKNPTELNEELGWLVPFFEKTWEEFHKDLIYVGLENRRAPASYWFERLQMRLTEATPPIQALKPREGVTLHRLGQAPLRNYKKVWLFGLPPDVLTRDQMGDYWFSERDREILTSEFSVCSNHQVRDEKIKILKDWISHTEETVFLDALYDWEGRERETLLPLLLDLGFSDPQPQSFGAHHRFQKSYGAVKKTPPLQFQLPPLKRRDIRATELDHYSRCSFRGLGAGRWKLWDLRDPGIEPWPEVRGRILHLALRFLKESRHNMSFDAPGKISGEKSPEQALSEAWNLERPLGMLHGARLVAHQKAKFLTLLEKFQEKEKEYCTRSQAQVFSLEGPELRLEAPEFTLHGVPDRIDIFPENHEENGFFLIDYKTSSSLPHGTEMVELGYRLQLPFYAIAAQKQLGKMCLGVQYVELNRTGGRGHGIFFKKFNGKEPGNLTHLRSKNNVLDFEPEEVWHKLETLLMDQAREYFQGHFEVRPKKDQECRSCPYENLCGKRRQGAQNE